MKRWVVTCAWLLLVSAVLRADVTITQTMTIEGPAAALMGNSAPPQIVMRIKGTKVRTETQILGQSAVVLSDLATKQIITLHATDKTARVVDAANPIVPAGAPMPETDITFKPTGQKRTIDDLVCDEYAVALTMDMASMGQPGSEAAQMLQGVKLVIGGSAWLARSGPGVSEFAAYQKAAVEANMIATVSSALGGAGNGFDKILTASAGVQGLLYLSEMTMNVEGSGQVADMMKQMGTLKMTNKVTSISTEEIPDSLFSVPADYKMAKQEAR